MGSPTADSKRLQYSKSFHGAGSSSRRGAQGAEMSFLGRQRNGGSLGPNANDLEYSGTEQIMNFVPGGKQATIVQYTQDGQRLNKKMRGLQQNKGNGTEAGHTSATGGTGGLNHSDQAPNPNDPGQADTFLG